MKHSQQVAVKPNVCWKKPLKHVFLLKNGWCVLCIYKQMQIQMQVSRVLKTLL